MNHTPQRAIMGIKWDNTSKMLYTVAGAENVLRTGQPGTGTGSVGHRQSDEDGGKEAWMKDGQFGGEVAGQVIAPFPPSQLILRAQLRELLDS